MDVIKEFEEAVTNLAKAMGRVAAFHNLSSDDCSGPLDALSSVVKMLNDKLKENKNILFNKCH